MAEDKKTENKPVKKIAILGGGVGSLVTAFELSDRPGWKEKFEITVYQMGWRLGGKGASGRNEEQADRIEEHGLHLWFGFYHNAFSVMRRCYEELGRNPKAPLATIEQAFVPYPHLGVMQYLSKNPGHLPDRTSRGGWIKFLPSWPSNSEKPGRGRPSTAADPWQLVGKLVELAQYAFSQLEQDPDPSRPHTKSLAQSVISSLLRVADLAPSAAPDKDGRVPLRARVAQDLFTTLLFAGRPFVEAGAFAGLGLSGRLPARPLGPFGAVCLGQARDMAKRGSQHGRALVEVLDALRDVVWNEIEDAVETSALLHRFWVLLDLAVSLVKGIVEHDVITSGWDTINQYDLREWLTKCGANNRTVNDGLVIGLYDFVFAFEDGDRNKMSLAAGSIMDFVMRMVLEYRGSLAWTMQAGMGDVVFAPLYEVLRRRGVKFKFFHKVTGLSLSKNVGRDEKHRVDEIRFDVQVDLAPEVTEYDPLRTVNDLPCWPNKPRLEQLCKTDAKRNKLRNDWKDSNFESDQCKWPSAGTLTLTRNTPDTRDTRDVFDEVVLGIPLGALALTKVADDLKDKLPRWRELVANVKTVRTLAMQLWLRPDLAGLGWEDKPAVVDGYAWPFSTYADMSHVIGRENWNGTDPSNCPGSLAYFCGALDEKTASAKNLQTEAEKWLDEHMATLWPSARDSNDEGGLNYDLLVDRAGRKGKSRLASQYLRANTQPSDRYVLTTPMSNKYRLHPDPKATNGSGCSNLYLAGDWTQNPLNTGCVEAATMSGMMAARALSEYPEEIVGERVQVRTPEPVEREKLGPFQVVGEHKGVIAVLNVRRSQVTALLPDGFKLDPGRPSPGDDKELVFVAAGERQNTHFTFPRSLPSLSYKEVLLAIPYVLPPGGVCSCGRNGSFLYVPKIFIDTGLFLEDRLAMAGAKAWGLAVDKGAVHQDRDGGSYQWRVVKDQQSVVVVESRSEHSVRPPSDKDFKWWNLVLEQPILSSLWGDRGTACADLDWNLGAALVKPVTVEVRFGGGVLKGALRGNHQASKSLALLPRSWRLSAPRLCRLAYSKPDEDESELCQ